MQNFTVDVFPSRDKTFLATYLHPLTKRRIRNYFDSKDKVIAFKQMIETKFRKSNPAKYHDLPVEDLLIIFKNDRPKASFTKMVSLLTDFIETFGRFQIEDVTTEGLRLWLDQRQIENNLKEVSIGSMRNDIECFFRYLVEKRVISASPLAPIYYKIEAPKISTRNILNPKQIDELLASVKDFSPAYMYPMIKFFAETAAKTHELCDLRWGQVDLAQRQIRLGEAEKIQARTLKISKDLASMLERNVKNAGPVFLTWRKEPFTKPKVGRLISEFKARGNCKLKWSPMDLRHSFAVNFLSSGGDLKELQYILGHAAIADTRLLYGEVIAKQAQENAESPFEIGS